VISAVELSLPLGGADGSEQAEAIQDFIDSGLSAFVIKDARVAGLENTGTGNARLRAMTLPTTHE
jgi:hypothetical protein